MTSCSVLGLASLAAGLALASPASAFEPEEPSPPPRAPFVEPPPQELGDFRDTRLAVSYGAGGYSTTRHGSGSVRDAWSLYLDHSWSSGLPGLLWSVGLDADLAKTNLARDGSTLYLLSADLGLGYGIPAGYNLQIELLPYVELVSAAVDHPFSNSVAWGAGAGGGAKVTVAYTFDSGLQLSVVGGYSLRWVELSGSCSSCATPGYADDVVMQVGRAGLAVGKRF